MIKSAIPLTILAALFLIANTALAADTRPVTASFFETLEAKIEQAQAGPVQSAKKDLKKDLKQVLTLDAKIAKKDAKITDLIQQIQDLQTEIEDPRTPAPRRAKLIKKQTKKINKLSKRQAERNALSAAQTDLINELPNKVDALKVEIETEIARLEQEIADLQAQGAGQKKIDKRIAKKAELENDLTVLASASDEIAGGAFKEALDLVKQVQDGKIDDVLMSVALPQVQERKTPDQTQITNPDKAVAGDVIIQYTPLRRPNHRQKVPSTSYQKLGQ